MEDIGTRLRQLRKKAKMNQAQFGALCDASKSAVSQWESGGTTPTLANVWALYEHFLFDFNWLIAGVGDLADKASSTHLVRLYHQLDERGRMAVQRVAEAESVYSSQTPPQGDPP